MATSMRQIFRGMVSASVGILGSRISGLARDIVFAAYWGTGNALGGFLVAFTVPNLFRRLLGEGALSEGFVPMFSEKLQREGKGEAFKLLNNVLSVVCLVLGAVVAIGMVVCLLLQQVVDGEMARLTLGLSAALLPYTFFICLVGFLTGVLNVFGSFSLPFLTPVILNAMLILGTVCLRPWLSGDETRQVYGLTAAVLIAGVLQLAAMWALLRRQAFVVRWTPRWRTPAMRELVGLVLPAFAGAGIYQVNVLCDRLLASWLGGYAVTSLYYSERLVFLPIGLFAVALSAVSLPVMSTAMAKGDEAGMMEALIYTLRQILFLTLPCVLIFMLIGEQIISLIFERGSFDIDSRSATFAALLFYAPGIPAFAAVKILRSAFYSRKDTRTPVIVSTLCIVVNLILNLSLMWTLEQRGLALATVLSTYLNVAILAVLLIRGGTVSGLVMKELAGGVGRLLVATAASGAVIWAVQQFTGIAGSPGWWQRLFAVGAPLAAGGLTYLAVLWMARASELDELRALIRSKLRR